MNYYMGKAPVQVVDWVAAPACCPGMNMVANQLCRLAVRQLSFRDGARGQG